MRRYFYELLHRYLSIFVTGSDSIVEVEPIGLDLISRFARGVVVAREGRNRPGIPAEPMADLGARRLDWVLLGGSLHYEQDIETLLIEVRGICAPETRLIVTYYSSLWKPLFRSLPGSASAGSSRRATGWRTRTWRTSSASGASSRSG